jgi:hypothetical protein
MPNPAKAPKPARPAARTSAPTAASYGRPGGGKAFLVVGGLIAAVFLVWLAWATWFQANPEVNSQLTGFEINGEHLAVAHIDVKLDPGVTADCVVKAIASDHSVVGEVHFSPVDGANTVNVRTERAATAVDLVGCTAAGQVRPR